jgi:hypothetical protein
MAYIELSPLFANGNTTSVLSALYRNPGSGSGIPDYSSSGPIVQPNPSLAANITPVARLMMFDGIKPTTPPLSTAVPDGSVILCTFDWHMFLTAQTVYQNETFVVNSNYIGASATGNATYFILWAFRFNPSAGSYSSGAVHAITGDIGLIGSGSDLEIANTNIVDGEQVRFLNLRFRIPRIFGA